LRRPPPEYGARWAALQEAGAHARVQISAIWLKILRQLRRFYDNTSQSCNLMSATELHQMNASSEMSHTEILAHKLDMLRREHRALDAQIDALTATALPDRITIQRLKKQKLALKDQITVISAQLIPNIIA
jgi:hypothetical protein